MIYTKIGFGTGTQPLNQTNMVKMDEGIYDAHQKADVANTTYIHYQGTTAIEWNVIHSLNKYPNVSVVDSADTIVIGNVEYISLNEVQITFSGAFQGRAYLN